MATENASPAPHRLHDLRSSARALFVGLLWGAVMLVLLAVWLRVKAPDEFPVLPWAFALLGLVSLGMALWQATTLWLRPASEEREAIGLANQRRTLAYALLGGGALLLVLALFLGLGQRPAGAGFGVLTQHFGEAAGLFLFALIVLAAGGYLLQPPREQSDANLSWLYGVFPLVKLGLLVLGGLALVVFLIASFYYRAGPDWFPELMALVLFSMLCLALGLWLIALNETDAFLVRAFVLFFGGGVGLILFLMTLVRAWYWRNDLFLGGLAAWQGASAWRFWLLAYLQLIALALMFGSLLLARADVRTNVVLRRLLFGYSTVLNGLLLVEMLLILNVVFYALFPYTYDWTQAQGLHALAESSKNLLHELKKPTEVYVLLPQSHTAYTEIRSLVENMQAESNQLKVHYVAPERDPLQYEKLARLFPEILPNARVAALEETGRGVLLVYGQLPTDEKERVPHAFIPERKIVETTPAGFHGQEPGKAKRVFKGEVEVMRELNFLVRGQEKRKVYFLQGHDELDLANAKAERRLDPRVDLSLLGISQLVEDLKKENYEVRGLSFAEERPDEKKKKSDVVYAPEVENKKEVPKDAYAVVIAGASRQLAPEALDALERYAERGGKLVVLLDVVAQGDFGGLKTSGLTGLLKKYGVDADPQYLLKVPRIPGTDPLSLIVTAPKKTENALAKQFWDQGMVLRTLRPVRPSPTPGRYRAEVVLHAPSGPEQPVLVEKQVPVLRDPIRYLAQLDDRGELLERISREPVPTAVAVSEGEKPRLVVFGDAEFISNAGLRQSRGANYAIFVSALEWLSERGEGFIGPRPKETTTYALSPTLEADTIRRMHLLPMWLMLLSVLGLGTGIWLVRRR